MLAVDPNASGAGAVRRDPLLPIDLLRHFNEEGSGAVKQSFDLSIRSSIRHLRTHSGVRTGR